MANEEQLREQLCDIGRRVYQQGMVAANDGNFSVLLSENEILCTPTGQSKGFLEPRMICKIDREGKVLQAEQGYGPTSEIKMHMQVYKSRKDVCAVVHAHPVYATAHAIVDKPLNEKINPEAVIMFGEVPIAPYALTGSEEMATVIIPYLYKTDTLLLKNHGALTYGNSLINAYYKMESLEFFAKTVYVANFTGKIEELNDAQVADLIALRKKMNLFGKHPLID